jgi:transketolase
VSEAIAQAKTETQRPTLIEIKTTIGYGSPNKANSSKAHGSPLGEDEVRLTKQALGWTESEPFAIPAEALAHFREAIEHGAQAVIHMARAVQRVASCQSRPSAGVG